MKLMEAESELNEHIMKECLVNIVSSEGLSELIANYRIISSTCALIQTTRTMSFPVWGTSGSSPIT